MTWFQGILQILVGDRWMGGHACLLISWDILFLFCFSLSSHFALVGFCWVVDIASMTRKPLAGLICAKKAWLWRDELDRARNPGGVEVTFPSNPTPRKAPAGNRHRTQTRPDSPPKNAHKKLARRIPSCGKTAGGTGTTGTRRTALCKVPSSISFYRPQHAAN